MRRKVEFFFYGSWCTVLNDKSGSQLNLTGEQGSEMLKLLVDSGLTRIAKHRIYIIVRSGLPSAKRHPVAVVAPGVAIAANTRHVQEAVELLEAPKNAAFLPNRHCVDLAEALS